MPVKRRIKLPVTDATRWAAFEGYSPDQLSKATIDCNGAQLEKLLRSAIDRDADEIVVRIAQYNPDLSPANYQAIVRFSNRTRAWACVVHKDPFQALALSLLRATQMQKEAKPNVRTNKSARTLQDTPSGRKPKPTVEAGKKPARSLRKAIKRKRG